MQLQWEGKVGPSAVIGAIGSLGVLVTVGIAWGSLSTKVDGALEIRATVEQMNKHAVARDAKVGEQAERIGKIETAVGFIVPTLQRIETKLEGIVK